jgi:hypothetical protein
MVTSGEPLTESWRSRRVSVWQRMVARDGKFTSAQSRPLRRHLAVATKRGSHSTTT